MMTANDDDSSSSSDTRPHFNFFIYTDNGSCVYKANSAPKTEESRNELGAMQGILQALYFSASDLKCEIKIMTTDIGLLGYKAFANRDKTLLLALVFPNYYGDEELAEAVIERILDYIFYFLLMHIGQTDLFSYNNSNELEKLKRYIDMYEKSILYILNNHATLNLLLKAEKKLEVEKEFLYSIKHYVETFKHSLKVDLICLTVKSSIVWASPDWLALDIIDRILFILLSEIYCESDLNEIPIYFTRTSLEDEGIGKIPYKFFCLNLMKDTKIIILSDSFLEIKKIWENLEIFDDFFISRILNLKNIISSGNEIIDTTAKSIVIYNSHLKTYKVLINENDSHIFSSFILNTHFSIALFNKSVSCDEFYTKDSFNAFTFYFFRIAALTFLIIFDKDTTFDDINNVKVTLKALREQFDNRDNYNATESDRVGIKGVGETKPIK